MITSPLEQDAGDESLGRLNVLSGVREFPVRQIGQSEPILNLGIFRELPSLERFW